MTTTNSYSRQPSKTDYASPTSFKFLISKLPKVEYFCTAVNVPGITLNTIDQMTSLKNIPIPGSKLDYADLNVSFLVDEDLQNYEEIHNWIVGLGFPESNSQFAALLSAGSDRFPTSSANVNTEPGKVKYGAPDAGGSVSDATLVILSSKNNPTKEIRFRDIFPSAIGGLSYNQQADDISYLSVDVTFKYLYYEFANVGASSTVVTHT